MLEVLRGASVACQVVVPMYSLCLLQVNGKSNSLLVWSLEPCNLCCKVALEGGGNLVPSRRGGLPVEGRDHIASLDVCPNHSSRRRRASMVEDFSAVRRGVKPRGEPFTGTVSRTFLVIPPLNVCTAIGERLVDSTDGVDASSVNDQEGAGSLGADYIANNQLDLAYDQGAMPAFRRRMAARIIAGTLDAEEAWEPGRLPRSECL